jgi:hypothetical protein
MSGGGNAALQPGDRSRVAALFQVDDLVQNVKDQSEGMAKIILGVPEIPSDYFGHWIHGLYEYHVQLVEGL